MAIEIPKYQVIQKDNACELRNYEGYITASVRVEARDNNEAANKSFGILADYIFGNNMSKAKIAMTAPVSAKMQQSSEKIAMTAPVSLSQLSERVYVCSFTMPSSYNLDQLPTPNNSQVMIEEVDAHEMAAIVFSGYIRPEVITKNTAQLLRWAEQNAIVVVGEPTILRYDPPWKPGFLRRNEIAFMVDPQRLK